MQPYAYGSDRNTTMALREVILTVLARGEMTGYEITKDFEAVYVHFWRASHQQVYRELARLKKDGRVTVKEVAQERRPDKKVYAITKRGLEELKRWIVEPTEAPRPQYDLLVKLLGCHVVDKSGFQRELERIRARAQEWLKELRAMRRECLRTRATWSEHDRILFLTLRRGLLLAQAQLRWLREVSEFIESGLLPE
jgi:PadR family transcriptional regulator, regulatory protein AphA